MAIASCWVRGYLPSLTLLKPAADFDFEPPHQVLSGDEFFLHENVHFNEDAPHEFHRKLCLSGEGLVLTLTAYQLLFNLLPQLLNQGS